MRPSKTLVHHLLCAALLAASATGCNAYRLKTPSGFAEVDSGDYGAHYKGSENVGLRIATFDNVKGGTLAFWSEDLVRKLGGRGYTLVAQAPVKSDNGVPGTRFDFDYDPPGNEDTLRRFAVVLFVTDEHKVVMQLAGTAEAIAGYDQQLGQIAAATTVRGCRAWTKICEGPQPGALSTPPAKDEPKAKAKAADTQLADEGAPQDG